ncbi:hypothetical protein ALC53_05714, partial [Atta colombica]
YDFSSLKRCDAFGVEEYDLRRKSSSRSVQQVGCDRATGRDSSAGAAERKGRIMKAPWGRGERDPRRPRAIGLLVRRERQESSRERKREREKEQNRHEIQKGGRERLERWETRDRGDRGERAGLVAGYAIAHTCANAAWHGDA